MPGDYCSAADVAKYLSMQGDTKLRAAVAAGASVLPVEDASLFLVGQTLAFDFYSSRREVIEIQATDLTPGANTVTTTALVAFAHPVGVPLKEVSLIRDLISRISRLWDRYCLAPLGFDRESVTEVLNGLVGSTGELVVLAGKPTVAAVTSLSYRTVFAPSSSVTPSRCWISGRQVKVPDAGLIGWRGAPIEVTIAYSGGYSPLPDDIIHGVTVLTARAWKSKDAGWSDAVGSADLGQLTYSKLMPREIKAIADNYKLWAVA